MRPEDGYLELRVQVRGRPSPLCIHLDLFEASNAAATIANRYDEETEANERLQAWCDYLKSRNVPPLSFGTALRVKSAVCVAAENFRQRARNRLADARLERFYGFPVSGVSPARKLEMEGGLVILEAEEELMGLRGPVPDSRVFDLVLLVTGSEERASAALAERHLARMKRGETPEA